MLASEGRGSGLLAERRFRSGLDRDFEAIDDDDESRPTLRHVPKALTGIQSEAGQHAALLHRQVVETPAHLVWTMWSDVLGTPGGCGSFVWMGTPRLCTVGQNATGARG
jgi:hypothetical protein